MIEPRGPGRFSITYVTSGGWDAGRHTTRLTLTEGQGWKEAQELLFERDHKDPLRPFRPTFTMIRWKQMADPAQKGAQQTRTDLERGAGAES